MQFLPGCICYLYCLYDSLCVFIWCCWFTNDWLIDLTVPSVDTDPRHQRHWQHSDTGYASQCDTGLETGLYPDQTTWVHRRQVHRDEARCRSVVTGGCSQQQQQQPRGADERRRGRKVSKLDCSVITRSSTTTLINNNQVCTSSQECKLKPR